MLSPRRARTSRFLAASALLLLLYTAGAGAQAPLQRCLGLTPTIVGTEGNDVLTGTDGDDVIAGMGGVADVLNGGPDSLSTDLLCGGEGNDTLQAGEGLAAVMSGDGGDDKLEPGQTSLALAAYFDSPAPVTVDLTAGTAVGWGTDSLMGIDHVIGSTFADVLGGSEKINVLLGFGGDDQLRGLGEGDSLTGDAGNDLLDGGPGSDEASFADATGVRVDLAAGTARGWGSDRLVAIEQVEGSAGADAIRGNGGANVLSGLGGNDTVSGFAGNDQVSGGPGNDRLAGGSGADRLDGGTGRDQGDGGPGRDRCVKIEKKKRCP